MVDVKLGNNVRKNGKKYEVLYFQFEIIFVFFSSVGKNLKTDFDLRKSDLKSENHPKNKKIKTDLDQNQNHRQDDLNRDLNQK